MKILMVGMSSNPGGIESYIMSVFRSLGNDENIVFYFLNDFENRIAYFDEIKNNNGKIINIKKPKVERHISELLWKIKLFKNNKFDIVHVNALTPGNIDLIRLANYYQKNVKLIIHSHNSNSPLTKNRLFKIKNGIWNNQRRWLKHHPEVIKLAASKESGEWMFGSSDNVEIIPNSIDVQSFLWSRDKYISYRKRLGFSIDKKIILVPSRIAEQKNYPKILNIFKSIVKYNKNFHLIIAGGGNKKAIQWLDENINNLEIQKDVSYIGVRNDMNELMIASDMMLMPSLYEGLGISALEGQAAGLRTFLSKGVIPDEVKVSKAAKFISLDKSSDEWAKIIIDLSKIDLDRKQCNLEVSKSKYSINNLMKKMRSVYYE